VRAGAPDPTVLVVKVNASDFTAEFVEKMKAWIQRFPGESEVVVEADTREGPRRLRFGDDLRVRASDQTRRELDRIIGRPHTRR
jgi:hypothetical protein